MSITETRAQALYDARQTRRPIAPFTDEDDTLTAADGYAVQQALVAKMLADGDTISGWKLGLTSKAMQEMIGVNEPDYGPVFRSMVFEPDVDTSALIAPKAEAEIAVVLDQRLAGPGVTTLDAANAIGGAVAAVEVVDSRIADWRIKLPDTIADLASCGGVVLATRIVPVDFELRLVGMTFSINGELRATGAGAAALGDPVVTVAWLANTLAPYGVTLEPGQFVMTGSLHAAIDVVGGDVVRAEFDRLGSVTLRMN
ncbi:MAG: fumarylacetoacetate hydrolase family protein [Acidimicrobiia bacterium]|nr:fumarylacetoacetate hydrolase family protein [Acidimicrobiia bacterium]